MKRVITCLLLACVWVGAQAQSAFTIVRPVDGSKVREEVHLLFPMESIPEGGYVGIFVGGKFIEATVPKRGEKYRDYVLDTKKLKLPDGKLSIEAVLYVDFNERPRIIDRSSIEIELGNKPNIPTPQGGFQLRYSFETGKNWIYKLDNRVYLGSISDDKVQKGGREAIMQVDSERVRLQYAIDNKYTDGDALMRMQALPDKGSDRVFLTTTGNPEGRWYFDKEMHSVYMRVHNTGMEVFGSVPQYFSMSGAPLPGSRTDLYAVFPLPTLPTKRINVGDTWQTRFQIGNINLDNLHGTTSLTEKIPARGEFLGVEWERGRPCAKLRHTFAVGRDQIAKPQSGVAKLEETIWFALDKAVVMKMVRNITFEEQITTNPQPSEGVATGSQGRKGGIGSAAARTPSGRPRKGGRIGAGGGGTGGMPGAGSDQSMTSGTLNQGRGLPRVGGAVQQQEGRPTQVELPSSGRLRTSAPIEPIITIVRRTFEQTFTLEQ